MDRCKFEKGILKQFIIQAQRSLGRTTEELGGDIGVSGRTLRDWKREKFYPPEEIIRKLSQISGVKLPIYTHLSRYWFAVDAARLGGKRRFELYGLLGNRESRVKGGVMSWMKRTNNPDIWKKYTKTFRRPKESIDFAEFIGIMLGDGGLTRTQCVVYLSSVTDQEYAYYIKEKIKSLFDLTASIYKLKKDKVWRVSISSVNLVEYLVSQGLSVGNKVHLQVGVPNWIWLNTKYIKACIRGLVDTDGSLFIHKHLINGKEYLYPTIVFSNRSQPLLEFVFRGLLQLGFHPKPSLNNQIWLRKQSEVKQYFQDIGTRNFKPTVKKFLESGPDGKAQVC